MKSCVCVRDWRSGDLARLRELGARLSPGTLHARFWGGVPALPESYLDRIATRWPLDWNAEVAICDGQLIGWAEFARNAPGAADADAAFCVIDAEQGHGVGTALLEALVGQAERAGIHSLHADIAAGNTAAIRAWRRATASAAVTVTVSSDGYRATLSAPAHAA